MVQLQKLTTSYVNTSGNLYDSEFINLVNIEKDEINFDDRTLFLTDEEKKVLNAQSIKKIEDAVYVFEYNGKWGILANLPINEYVEGNVKSHELVLPSTIQGMLSNLHGYNTEAAPVLLAHEKRVDLENLVSKGEYSDTYQVGSMSLYAYCGDVAEKVLNDYQDIEELYIGDGHHRLYTSSLSDFKKTVFSCVFSFDNLDILPINRTIEDITFEQFDHALKFLQEKFEVKDTNEDSVVSEGTIQMSYAGQYYSIKLIDLLGDSFWNNDIYRLNTQILSQAFRTVPNENINYLSLEETKALKKSDVSSTVLFETAPLSKDAFITAARSQSILPPKSTWMNPKFPSFLVMNIYHFED